MPATPSPAAASVIGLNSSDVDPMSGPPVPMVPPPATVDAGDCVYIEDGDVIGEPTGITLTPTDPPIPVSIVVATDCEIAVGASIGTG